MRLAISLVAVLQVLPVAAENPVSWHNDFASVADTLKSNEALFLLDTLTEREGVSWHLTDKTVSPLKPPMGRQLRLVKLRVGKYAWGSVEVPYFDLPYRLSLADQKRWQFTVARDQLNYLGMQFVGETRATSSIDVRLINRTAEVRALLLENHPELLNRFELTYSGYYPDDFLRFVSEAQ